MSSRSGAGEGIHQIPLPTPWPVGDVNVFLIEDEPLTLVDTGPLSDPALDALERALAALGYSVEALERVVVTHQHVDHWGQAALLVQRSGAELCALDGLADWLAAYPESLAAEDRLAGRVLRRHGASDVTLKAERETNRGEHQFGIRAEVTMRLNAEDTLAFAGRSLRVLHLPGHSPSDTAFYDDERGIALTGDVLLAGYPTSAIISPPLDGSEVVVRPPALSDYITSLQRLHTLELELLLPGHGDPVSDHRRLITERLAATDAKTARIGALLTDEPRTASEIALELRGRISDATYFFVLCEVLGHLDRLVQRGSAIELDTPVKRFLRGER